jgi:hypothetical protein
MIPPRPLPAVLSALGDPASHDLLRSSLRPGVRGAGGSTSHREPSRPSLPRLVVAERKNDRGQRPRSRQAPDGRRGIGDLSIGA